MALSVIVRSATGAETRLTFDGTQRIVLGRGASCDVRLPDPSVSHRHASLRAQGTDFVLFDEDSTNGTFVGDVRIASRTSRVVRSGDHARLGRVWIEVRVDHSPVTRDLAAATRDLALAMIAQALDAIGEDQVTKVTVVEGRDQGAVLPLLEEGRVYLVGRAAECDLPLADPDASRTQARIVRRGGVVLVRSLPSKNGTWLGETRVPEDREVPWRTTQMMRVGQTVLAQREPVSEALARIEQAADVPVAAGEVPSPPPVEPPEEVAQGEPATSTPAPVAEVPSTEVRQPRRRTGWSVIDLAVMAAAVGVLALSIAGLIWLLRG